MAQDSQTTKVMSPSIVEENFSVKDLRSAWELNIEHQRSDNPASSLSSLINRTEVAFNEVEATFQAVENKMDQALLHTEKLIDNSRQGQFSISVISDWLTNHSSELIENHLKLSPRTVLLMIQILKKLLKRIQKMKIRFYPMQKLAKQILHRILQRQLQIIHLMNFIQGILLDMIRETWTVDRTRTEKN